MNPSTEATTITKDQLINYGISSKKIEEGIRDNLSGKTNFWETVDLSIDKGISFLQSSLPANIEKLIPQKRDESLEVPKEYLLPGGKILDLMHAYEIEYQDHIYLFNEVDNESLRNKYARKYAVLSKCAQVYIDLKCKRGIKKKIYFTLRKIGIEYYTNEVSFKRIFNQFIHSEKPHDLVRYNTSNRKRRRVTEWHIAKIIDLLGQGYLVTAIKEELDNINPSQKLSYSTIQDIITPEIRNIVSERRYGYRYFKKNLEPYIRRQKPSNIFQVVEADGSRFQIPYLDENGNIKFLKIFVIIDVCSSYILGFSAAPEEDTKMIIEAFMMMFDVHHLVPACVVTDNAKPIQSDRFIRFKEETHLDYGTIWRKHDPDFPNAKGTVESFFKNFHIQFIRNYNDYIGLGITCTSDEHKIKKEKVKQLYKNKKLLKSKTELIHFIGKLIHQWNTKLRSATSPEIRFNISDPLDAKPISNQEIARLCWEMSSGIVKNSKIQFSNNEYEIVSNETRRRWNTRLVEFYFHPKAPDFIFLYKERKFIDKIYLKRTYEENDPTKFHKIKQNKSFRAHIEDKYLENRESLNQIEYDAPFLSLFYEKNKLTSNEEFERFFNNYILSETQLEEDDTIPTDELPDLNF